MPLQARKTPLSSLSEKTLRDGEERTVFPERLHTIWNRTELGCLLADLKEADYAALMKRLGDRLQSYHIEFPVHGFHVLGHLPVKVSEVIITTLSLHHPTPSFQA